MLQLFGASAHQAVRLRDPDLTQLSVQIWSLSRQGSNTKTLLVMVNSPKRVAIFTPFVNSLVLKFLTHSNQVKRLQERGLKAKV